MHKFTPTLNDLTVTRNRDGTSFEISSSLTRGRCATVIKMFGRLSVMPALIPRYMQGITTDLIKEAVHQYLKDETKSKLKVV